MVTPNRFVLRVDGVRRASFNTSSWTAGEQVVVPLYDVSLDDASEHSPVAGLADGEASVFARAAEHSVSILKTSEAQDQRLPPTPNYMALHGFHVPEGALMAHSRLNPSAFTSGTSSSRPAASPSGRVRVTDNRTAANQNAVDGVASQESLKAWSRYSGGSMDMDMDTPSPHSGHTFDAAAPLRLEFVGDSITAGLHLGMCETCSSLYTDPYWDQFWASDGVESSWAGQTCAVLGAECHIEAWSGYGIVRNCCGGETLMGDIWRRTLASVGSGTPSTDPHGTRPENLWDFSKWRPHAMVINLGTNDRLGRRPHLHTYFQEAYLELLRFAADAYGRNTTFVLACGPLRTDYCADAQLVAERATSLHGIRAHALELASERDCCAHPDAQGHAELASATVSLLTSLLGL